MEKKDEIVTKVRITKMVIAAILAAILAISQIVHYTPLVRYYAINKATSIINDNTINILFIVVGLLVLQKVEQMRFQKKIDEAATILRKKGENKK